MQSLFITLTGVHQHGVDKIHLRIDSITLISPARHISDDEPSWEHDVNAGLRIVGTNGFLPVVETPDEVRALIKAAQDKALRDQFAMAVLQSTTEPYNYQSFDSWAKDVSVLADEMMKARGK